MQGQILNICMDRFIKQNSEYYLKYYQINLMNCLENFSVLTVLSDYEI